MSADNSFANSIKAAALWLFLAPLIIIIGVVDFATDGRSRSWPLGQ